MTLAIKRAAQVNFVSVDDIANFVKKKFDNKLKNLNKDVMLNKIEINKLSNKVKALPTKVLIKDLINKFNILS